MNVRESGSAIEAASIGNEGDLFVTVRVVDAVFQVGQGREHIIEAGRLGEIHVPHRLVITPQGWQTRERRDETKGPGFAWS